MSLFRTLRWCRSRVLFPVFGKARYAIRSWRWWKDCIRCDKSYEWKRTHRDAPNIRRRTKSPIYLRSDSQSSQNQAARDYRGTYETYRRNQLRPKISSQKLSRNPYRRKWRVWFHRDFSERYSQSSLILRKVCRDYLSLARRPTRKTSIRRIPPSRTRWFHWTRYNACRTQENNQKTNTPDRPGNKTK